MKKLLLLALICLLPGSTALADELLLGEKLILQEATKVSAINAHPQKYLNKRVQIRGIVIDVCAARGCWMDISSDEPFDRIRVKVVDGQIVFPLEARGRMATVEGIVEKIELNYEQALIFEKHRAFEQGKKFDPASVTGPKVFYRISGLGAVIH